MATRASDLVDRTTPRRRWRRALAPAILVLALPLVAGCADGFGAATNRIYQPGPGLENRSGDVFVINAAIVTNGTGNGTLVAALINQVRPGDALLSATAKTSTGTSLKVVGLTGMPLLLPYQTAVQVNDLASDGVGGIRFTGRLEAGTIVSMHSTFRNAAPVVMNVPIVQRTEQFKNVNVANGTS